LKISGVIKGNMKHLTRYMKYMSFEQKNESCKSSCFFGRKEVYAIGKYRLNVSIKFVEKVDKK